MTAAVLTADAIAPDLDGAAISRYNALVDQRNPIAQQLNGLLC